MNWPGEEIDAVTSRIEKINMQFSKLLEEMNVSAEPVVTPVNFKVSLEEIEKIEQPSIESNIISTDINYYANIIEKSRQVKGVPKHAIALDMSVKDRMILDEQLSKMYSAKKASKVVYNMKDICDTNKENMITIEYATIPTERALTVKKTWKDILFAEVDLNKQIDVWGAVKKFCKIQIKL
ncbi:MAG: hypothetical protein J6B87_00985 [Clostridia bacterium]|nr:hypothetical protein [Clostridia bacterium]